MTREDLKKLLISFKEEDFFENVDLHIHSNISDGKMLPENIVEQAKKLNMKYIAIADHNSVDAYCYDCIANESIVIPAVEFDCFYKGVIIHILGYGININNDKIQSVLAKSDLGKKFNLYRIFHMRNPKTVIDAIKDAGGIPVLAHPACYWCLNLDNYINDLKNLGIEGVEVFYPYRRLRSIVKFHSRNTVYKLAKKYNLIMTGGSDCHSEKYIKIELKSVRTKYSCFFI